VPPPPARMTAYIRLILRPVLARPARRPSDSVDGQIEDNVRLKTSRP